jgi:hypothetical protein
VGELWKDSLAPLRRQPRMRIHAAKSVEAGDAVTFARERLGFDPDPKQEMVLRGGRRGIVNCTRQWGKSTVTAAKAVHRAYSAPGSLTMIVAPSGRQSGEFLRKAVEFAGRLEVEKGGDGTNKISLEFPNGSRIVGVPRNEATSRGFSKVSLLLIDEASRVDDAMYRAMRPMLAVGDGDLWLMSTPNGPRGFFWEEWDHGTEGWERISYRRRSVREFRRAYWQKNGRRETRSTGRSIFASLWIGKTLRFRGS